VHAHLKCMYKKLPTDSQARPSNTARKMEGRACESAFENDASPKRKSLPHHPTVRRHNQSTIIFLTICVKDRRKLLAQDEIHELMIDCWGKADAWMVGRYMLMPDHLHLFCAPASNPILPLRDWVYKWRGIATRQWPVASQKPIWQKDFFDRQLRRGQSYSEKWNYMVNNPVRAGLVEKSEEWTFQGELNRLSWQETA
jgi:putative transposase